jgi:LPPG:FO 2-phospho-L-lactate transferase
MSTGKVIVLSGGVGGAKLVLGLAHAMAPEDLIAITNTGDDFTHYGLRICPDTDTVLYTLSGLADRQKGWGRANETWTFMEALGSLGGEQWFNLGDGDLALHVLRTDLLNKGETLSSVIAGIARSLAIKPAILPMCDQTVSTIVDTPDGKLGFQDYFVREQCRPRAIGFEFQGIQNARPNPALVEALAGTPAAIIIAPSNPFVSVDPILSLPGMREALRDCGAPIVAVSPIVGGRAIKGPAAKMMSELGLQVSATEIARRYANFIDLLIIDEQDINCTDAIVESGVNVLAAPAIMTSLADRIALAKTTLEAARRLRGNIKR